MLVQMLTVPPPEDYEILLTRKIKAQKVPVVQTFVRFDEDDDGRISKNDMRSALRNTWEMELSDDQIDNIFNRASYFAPKRIKENRRDDSSTESVDYQKIGLSEYLRYVEETSSSVASNSLKMEINSSPSRTAAHASNKTRIAFERKITTTSTSTTLSAKELKKKVYTKIQHKIPSSLRHRHIAVAEFRLWLKQEGLNLTEEQINLVIGHWRKDEEISFHKFEMFISQLGRECEEHEVKTFENEVVERQSSSISSASSTKRYFTDRNEDDCKSDEELIWSLLTYFRDTKKSYTKGFDMLDVSNSMGLSAQDIRKGLAAIGTHVSLERSQLLTFMFVEPGGRMTKLGFVRLMTSVPQPPEN